MFSANVIFGTRDVNYCNSAAGRQLLNRIRLLQKENEELGQQLSEGQIHKLELEISMQRELAEELKRTLDGTFHQKRADFVCFLLNFLLESNEFVMQLSEETEKRLATALGASATQISKK